MATREYAPQEVVALLVQAQPKPMGRADFETFGGAEPGSLCGWVGEVAVIVEVGGLIWVCDYSDGLPDEGRNYRLTEE